MLSPDPIRQAPGYSQNYDAYAYAFNNPLKYTDPSSYVTTGYRGPYMGEGSSAGAQPPVYYVDGMPVSSSIARAVLGGGSGGGAAGKVDGYNVTPGSGHTVTYFDPEVLAEDLGFDYNARTRTISAEADYLGNGTWQNPITGEVFKSSANEILIKMQADVAMKYVNLSSGDIDLISSLSKLMGTAGLYADGLSASYLSDTKQVLKKKRSSVH